MLTVMLTCAGRRHYLASYFRAALSADGRLVGADMDPTAPALQACDAKYRVPEVFADDYLAVIKEIAVKEGVDMLFSLNDLEAGLLAEHRDDIERETGATVYVPPLASLRVCADKWHTYRFAREIGIDAPATYLTTAAAMAAIEIGEVEFPLIVKPRSGSASIGLFVVDSADGLIAGFEACRHAVATTALASLGLDDAVIIQERIEGREYGMDVLYGKDERFIGFAVKRKMAMRAGETDKAITVSPGPFEGIVERIVHALPHRGNLDCDLLERDGKFYLLEFNPRFGGGYPFTHLAQANHVQMLLDDYRGLPLPPYAYRTGRAFAKCDTLVEVPSA